MNFLNFIRPSKDKIVIFLSMIILSFILFLLNIFLHKFFILDNFYYDQRYVYDLFWIVANTLRYFLVSFLVISFIEKKFTLSGRYYNIFKIILLLASFGFLLNYFYIFLHKIIPEDIYFSNWNFVLALTPILSGYYIIACFIHNLYFFREKLVKS